jgi:predicted phage terminase large subunit-like protein
MPSGITKALGLRDKLKAIDSERAKRLARGDLLQFIRYTRPDYKVNWHHRLICKSIDEWLKSSEPYNLILSIPPQHGKSEICSRFLPAYIFGKNADSDIVAASYDADLIESMSRDTQRIIDTAEYHELFPETTIVQKGNVADVNAIRRANMFTIQRRRGRYRCAGVGGGLAGHPGQYGIIDDPIKGREQAESKANRLKLVDWYNTQFRTRLHSAGRTLMLLTRWHVDDLAGHVLRNMKDNPDADRWRYIIFPAIYEKGEYTHPDDPRAEGDALWPDFQDEKYFTQTRASIRDYDWYALYQQRPSRPGGNAIKRSWIQMIDANALPVDLVWVRFWDLAVTEKTKADWTASVQLAMDDYGRIYVRHIIHDQVEWPTAREMFVLQAVSDQVAVGIETSATQKGFFQDLLTEERLRDIPIYGYSPDKSKLVRAQPWIARAQAGKFFLVRGAGCDDYIDELVEFTGMDDTHDDLVDATSGAYHMIASDQEPEVIDIGDYEID